MAKWMIFIALLIFLATSGLALPGTAVSAPAFDSMPATVKIVRTWQSTEGRKVYDVTGVSLGTIVAPNIILTHNHFGITLGNQSPGMLTIADKAHHSWRWWATDAQSIVINAGISLIRLPINLPVPGASLADDTDLRRLTVGSWLTVNYWDDKTQRPARRDFPIIQVKDDSAQLADPDLVINTGDSGGGVFFNGKLIGTTWSINLDSTTRQAAGSFNVALLPVQVRSYVK